jgi:nucleoside-diphosphate-sugar epimerase
LFAVTDRVIVTGGSGRVGRYVLRELRIDFDVVNVDLRPGELSEEYLACNLLDRRALRRALRGATAVCHLGGLDYDVAANPSEYLHVNSVGTWNVLEAAAEVGVRIVVLASSSSVYGLLDSPPASKPQYLPIDEAHPCVPIEAYSLSKLFVEHAGQAWARSRRVAVVALRPLHVVSVETMDQYDRFVAAAPRGWLYNYVAAEDVARGFRAAMLVERVTYDVFLLGAEDTSMPEPTLEWYARDVGQVPEVRDVERYRSNPVASVFTSARASDVLGWRPRVRMAGLRAATVTQ